MKREIYAVFKYGEFVEAAWVNDRDGADDADRYIRSQERRLGQVGFSYKWGSQALFLLPKGYKPRIYIPKTSNKRRKSNDFIAKFTKLRAEDDGVNYEKDEP